MPTNMEGTRPLTGPALPNLINAVSMLKSKSTSKPRWWGWCRGDPCGRPRCRQTVGCRGCRGDRPRSPAMSGARDGLRYDVDVDFDFNILTAFIRLGRAGPAGAGCPPYLQALCPPYYYLTFLTYFTYFTLILTFNLLQTIIFLRSSDV